MAVATDAARADTFLTLLTRHAFPQAGLPADRADNFETMRDSGGLFALRLQCELMMPRAGRRSSLSEQF
jgi:hypothetical protein